MTSSRPHPRLVVALSVGICAASVLWLQVLHATLGAREHHEPPLVVHWLRDSILALPLVVSGVWTALLLVGRGPRRGPAVTVVAAGLGASVSLALGAPAHGWLFGAHESLTQHDPSFFGHLVRDAALALPAALLAAGAGLRLAARRTPSAGLGGPRAAGRTLVLASPLTRRQAIGVGLAGSASLLLPFEWARTVSASDFVSPPATPFAQALPVPPAAVPTARTATQEFYSVTARVGESQIYPTGPKTRIWGYDGISPGPTFLAEGGREAVVTFRNELGGEREFDGAPVALTTHFHGGHQAPTDDGWATDLPADGIQALIAPGASRDYHLPNLRDLANEESELGRSLWYHDHVMDQTAFNVYQGLAGVYVVHSDDEDNLDLPGTGADAMPDFGYGIVELPLLLQDKSFRSDHSLFFSHDPKGVLGDRFLVNGAIQPFTAVQRRRYRLRIYNGSNRRWYNLRLSSGQPFIQVGSDQGLLAAPVARNTMLMGPAERLDVIVDFAAAPGTVYLETRPAGFDECNVAAPLLRFDVAPGSVTDPSRIPDRLRVIPVLPPPVRERSFRFDRGGGEWVINGKRFDPLQPVASPRLGTTEAWTFINSSGGWVHPIHVHDVPFQILARDGRTPPPWERGEKDTVALGHNVSARISMQFIDFTGPYVLHCHNTDHEDMRMMARFDVVA